MSPANSPGRVRDDQAVVVGGVEDVDLARLHDEQIDVCLPRAEDDFAVGERLRRREMIEQRKFGLIENRECRRTNGRTDDRRGSVRHGRDLPQSESVGGQLRDMRASAVVLRCAMPTPPMSDVTTHGVRIGTSAFYLQDESTPADRDYLFGYNIVIANTGEQAVQLISRHWLIIDAAGRVEEVRGPGVVGQTPHLKPGEAFKYASFAIENSLGNDGRRIPDAARRRLGVQRADRSVLPDDRSRGDD